MKSIPARGWLRIVQIFVTGILIFLLWRTVEWTDFRRLIGQVRLELILFTVMLLLFCHLTNILRWKFLIGPNPPPFRNLLTLYGIGLFSNNFLPTGIGGDGVRAVLTSRYISLTTALLSVGKDRLVGLSTLGLFFVLGLWLGLPTGLSIKIPLFYRSKEGAVLIISGIVLAGIVVLIVRHKLENIRLWLIRLPSRYIGTAVFPSWKGRDWIKPLIRAYGFSALGQTIHVVAYWVLLKALNIQGSFNLSLWLVLLGSAIVLLPISINGLGLQESTYVVVLNGYGVETTTAIGFALVVRILLVMFSLVGGLFLLGYNSTSLQFGKRPPL